jgi:PAS domain S-box-containing protein/putative nucleotidyltransferase with HDIG domain
MNSASIGEASEDASHVRIALLEDSDDDAELVLYELRRAGYTVAAQRSDSREAFLASLTSDIDIVLADYSLPGFNGLDALALLSESGYDIPFILISGTIGEELAVQAMQGGAADYLLKDRLSRLGHAVKRALDQQRVRKALKRAEAALRRSESLHRQLFERSLDAILVFDDLGDVLQANEAAEALLGVSNGDLIGKNLSQFVSSIQDSLEVHQASYVKTGKETGTIIFVRSDGAERIAEYAATQFAPGHHVSILRDVTERMVASEQLKQSREHYKALIEAMPQIVWTAAYDGAVDYLSSQWEEYSGCALDATLARGWEHFLYPEDVEAARAACLEAYRSEQSFQVEYRLLGADGTYRWFLARGVPLKSHDGKTLRWFGTFTNIDSQKQAEQSQRFLAELALRIRPIVEPALLVKTITESVGTYLNASRCAFVEVDLAGNQCSIYPAYHSGMMPDLAGTYTLAGFGTEVLATLRSGSTLFIQDVLCDPRTADQNCAAYKVLTVRSMLCVPVIKEGQWVGALSVVTNDLPRYWTEAEADLLEHVVEQLWLALENVRLYQAAQAELVRRQQAEARIRRQFERLSALRAIDSIISSSHEMSLTLEFCLDEMVTLLKVDAACISLHDRNEGTLRHVATRGFWHHHEVHATTLPVSGQAGQVVQKRVMIHILEIREALSRFAHPDVMLREEFVSYIGVPLIVRGRVLGVLEVFCRTLLDPDLEWLEFIQTLASQAAIAIENATLFESLQHTNAGLREAYEATIEGWSRALDLRDNETEGHSQRVTTMTMDLARSLGIGDEDLIHIRRGALLHDIGKMGIPDKILRKPAPLNKREQEIMQRHPQYALDMLSPISFLRESLDIPYCHHEKWDGTGYPRGLKGEEIPLAARIFAVADVYDALCSDRPYRKAWAVQDVLEYIRSQSGIHFDPAIVEAFLAQRVSELAGG